MEQQSSKSAKFSMNNFHSNQRSEITTTPFMYSLEDTITAPICSTPKRAHEESKERTQKQSSRFKKRPSVDQSFSVISSQLLSLKLHNLRYPLLLMIYLTTIFVTTVDSFFKTTTTKSVYWAIYAVAASAFIQEMVVQCYSYLDTSQQRLDNWWDIGAQLYLRTIGILYLILKVTDVPQRRTLFWSVFEVGFIVMLLWNISNKNLITRTLGLFFRKHNEVRLVELFFQLIIILHFVSTLLICITYSSPTHNWLTSLDIDHHNQLSVYLRAFYFATTTIITVGFGDVSPKNDLEVAFMILIEIFGVILFVYMTNRISQTISELRKEKEAASSIASISEEKIKCNYQQSEFLDLRSSVAVSSINATKLLQVWHNRLNVTQAYTLGRNIASDNLEIKEQNLLLQLAQSLQSLMQQLKSLEKGFGVPIENIFPYLSCQRARPKTIASRKHKLISKKSQKMKSQRLSSEIKIDSVSFPSLSRVDSNVIWAGSKAKSQKSKRKKRVNFEKDEVSVRETYENKWYEFDTPCDLSKKRTRKSSMSLSTEKTLSIR